MEPKEIAKLMGAEEVKYDRELVELLVAGLKAECLDEEAVDRLVSARYITVQDGQAKIVKEAREVIKDDSEWVAFWDDYNAKQAERDEADRKQESEELVGRWVSSGEVVLDDAGKCRVTERGWLWAGMSFSAWLCHRTRYDDFGPYSTDFLYLDGIDKASVLEHRYDHVSYRSGFWQRLHKYLCFRLLMDGSPLASRCYRWKSVITTKPKGSPKFLDKLIDYAEKAHAIQQKRINPLSGKPYTDWWRGVADNG